MASSDIRMGRSSSENDHSAGFQNDSLILFGRCDIKAIIMTFINQKIFIKNLKIRGYRDGLVFEMQCSVPDKVPIISIKGLAC